jgi:phosphate-selective porin OprO/OprP
VQVGKFKEPVSYEQLIQDRFVPTLERSLIDNWVPARDVGLMLHGQKLLGDRFDYAIGVFNGETNGDLDTNDVRDIAARIAVRPFGGLEEEALLHGLQLGISASTGVEHEPISPAVLRTPGTVPWFAFNPSVRADGLRNRWTPEISYFHRSLGFAAQYLRVDQEMLPRLTGPGSTTVIDLPVEGCYFLFTYLLTGEERTTYSQAIKPLRPFDPSYPLSHPGAWELVARFSQLRIGDEVFAPGDLQLADPARFSSAAWELTLGFNWYLNPWVRMQFNWEHARFHNPVLLGPPSTFLREQNTLLTRFQVIF